MSGAVFVIFVITLAGAGVTAAVALRWLRRLRTLNRSLKAQAQWYQNALDCAGVGVWHWNLATNEWQWANSRIRIQGTGESFRIAAGAEFFEHIHPEDRQHQFAEERACIAGRRSLRTEYRYLLPNGEERWLRDIGDMFQDETGQERHMLGITLDITSEKHSTLRLGLDDLTGLPNRRSLRDDLERAFAQAPGESRIALAFLDLDGFKQLNDLHGHEFGDRCLAELGTVSRGCCRPGERMARLGGDEFVLVIENAGQQCAAAARLDALVGEIMDRLRAAMNLPGLSASVGIAFFPDNGRDVSEVIRHADSAMYEAKKVPGDNVHLFGTEKAPLRRSA